MTLSPEEEGRANFYGLMSRLFYGPPDEALLGALATADELHADDEALAKSWRELQAAAAASEAEAVREEYETVFVGTGKAPVTLYTGAYSMRYTNEMPLAELKGDLMALGLARRASAGEPEDHVASLCETMRRLIVTERTLEEQKRFFSRWIYPTVDPLCDAIQRSEEASFYKPVAHLYRQLCSVEHIAFEML